MELQNGIVAGDATFPMLVDEVARIGLIDTARRVCDVARSLSIPVLHNTKVSRPDGLAETVNCKVFAMSAKLRQQTGVDPTQLGTSGADLVDGLENPSDFVMARLHGMTPFTSTSLDQVLRNMGIKTVVTMGVSVNLGVFGMALGAVDRGYQVVLVRDAVAGVPREYAQQVIEQSLSLITTVVTSQDLLAVWGGDR
jgi:nicotinamidase-related amidase